MYELVSFKALEFVVALGIVYASYRLEQETGSRAWQILALSGTILAGSVLTQMFLVVNNIAIGILEGMFAPSVAVLLSGAGISFLERYGSFGRAKADHFAGFCFGVVAGLFALGLLVPSYMAVSIFYMGTPFLLIPALYTFYRMMKEGNTAVFASLFSAVVLYTVASLMNIYTAATCLYCSLNPYKFIMPFTLPEIDVLVKLSLSAPVITMAGTLMLGFSVYLFYHGVFGEQEIEGIKEGENQ